MTRISVVAPNLNEAHSLPMFLSSLTHQTFQDFEVIIVDGGSKDDSLAIIGKFLGKLNMRVIIDKTKNIGFIRNLGVYASKGNVLFQTSSDTFLEPQLLEKIMQYYEDHKECVALTGRTYPLGTSVFAHVGYQLFDLLRWFFTQFGFPTRKFRPSGNFFVLKREVFETVGGFPEVKINEDGLLGQKLDQYLKQSDAKAVFHLGLYVGHNVKRFEAKGGLQALLFYIYVLGNMFPLLKPLFNHIERRSAEAFASRSDLGGETDAL